MSEMTDYQKTVAEHMATAPQELREYVCGKLKEGSLLEVGRKPLSSFHFFFGDSGEGESFWEAVYAKEWQIAMSTEFWKSRQQQKPDHYKQFSCESIISMATDFRQSHQQPKPKAMKYTGRLVEGDFERNTMTFRVDGELILQAGKYKIEQVEVGNAEHSTDVEKSWFESLPLHWRYIYHTIGGIVIGYLLHYVF